MTRRIAVAFLILLISIPLAAQSSRRRSVVPPGAAGFVEEDVLGIGKVSGAAVSGTVASLQGSVIAFETGSAPAIRVDASHAKFVADHSPASIADLKPGVRITAFIVTTAPIAAGAPLPAQLIAIEPQADLTLSGPVESIDVAGSKLAILGITVAVDANTSYSSAFPTFAPITGLTGIAVGNIVTVSASFANGAILAKRIQVVAPSVPPVLTLTGTVKSISSTAWIITGKDGKDTTVTIDAQTKIVGEPKVGDSVQVMVAVDNAHNYLAVAIVKLAPTGMIKMQGWVASIGPEQWTIGGPPGSMAPVFPVKITATTVIYPDPKVGDRVTISGVRDANGSFTATKIAKDGV